MYHVRSKLQRSCIFSKFFAVFRKVLITLTFEMVCLRKKRKHFWWGGWMLTELTIFMSWTPASLTTFHWDEISFLPRVWKRKQMRATNESQRHWHSYSLRSVRIPCLPQTFLLLLQRNPNSAPSSELLLKRCRCTPQLCKNWERSDV